MPFAAISSKALLTFIPLFLLSYSFNTQALSATTANTIQGTAPYLTFDNGATKVTTTDKLLSITLSDTTANPPMTYIITPSNNTSTVENPYVLFVADQTFADIGMLVPPSASSGSVTLHDLVNTYNYWGDDDGDGQDIGGISAIGSLSVVITDKNSQTVNRNDALSICNAPYKVVLTSTTGKLSTQYGKPNNTDFNASNVTYYVKPKGVSPCFAKPNMSFGTGYQAGPANMWNDTKGFIPQSIIPAGYSNNFPTTGTNGLYFDLELAGSDSTLDWPPVTVNGITATMTPDASGKFVQVKLTGPTTAIPPSPFNTEGAPFELKGKSSGTTVVKYGFTIKKWYVHSGIRYTGTVFGSWCAGMGYRQPKVNDLTNASGGTWTGATPISGGNYNSRVIGGGFFSEWGNVMLYTEAGISDSTFLTSDVVGILQYSVSAGNGYVSRVHPGNNFYGMCTYP